MVKAEDVLADPAKFKGQKVWLTGEIIQVCASSGCWVKLMPEGSDPTMAPKGVDTTTIFVKLTCPSEGFLVPLEAKGNKAIAHGEVVVEEVPEADAKHYAEEGGATADGGRDDQGDADDGPPDDPGRLGRGVSHQYI